MMTSLRGALMMIALAFVWPHYTLAQDAPVAVAIDSLTVSAATIQPGQTIIFTAVLTANQTVSNYPIEFSWVAPGASSGTNAVMSVNYQANQSVTATARWTVPANAAIGQYTLAFNAFNPAWNVPDLAGITTTFNVNSGSASPPMAVSVNLLTATPTFAQPGQTVSVTAILTATQSATNYPIEFSLIAPGASQGLNAVVYATYVAGQSVTETGSWTVPAGSPPGMYKLVVGAFDPNWDVPDLGDGTTSFFVGVSEPASEPGPSAALFSSPFYTCLRNFYVATTGQDSNAGTATSPWATIQHADSSSRRGGDCVNVAPGLYEQDVLIQHGGNAPTPAGYVAYRCQTLDGCHVLAPRPSHVWGFEGAGNFVVVDGFEVDGNNALQTDGIADTCFGSDAPTYGTGKPTHHVWIINNIIHHCNEAGVAFSQREWYYVIHNTVYHNAWTSGYQGSGIGLVVVQCIESGNAACASGATYKGGTGNYKPSGMDLTYAPPFHIVVSWNSVYDNMIAANNPVACGAHTDGNGIIMDTFLDMATLSIVYPYQTLVSNNASYANGGRGIHVFRASNVTVASNTVYGNGTDPCLSAYYLGDLSQAGGANNAWINNISQSVLTPINPACAYCGGRNTPLVAGDAAGIVDLNNTYLSNVTDGGDGVQLFGNDGQYFTCANNQCNIDPMLVSPSSANFALQAGSPAIGYGKLESYLPATAVDAGVCPSTLQTCP